MENRHHKRIAIIEDTIEYNTSHLNNLSQYFAQVQSLQRVFSDAGVNTHQQLFKGYESMIEFNSLVTICTLDLAVSAKGLMASTKIWEEIFHLRSGYLTIHSFLDKYGQHRKWLSSLAELQTELAPITKKLRSFKRNYNASDELGTIRNKVTAHIDSFAEYFPLVSGFDRGKALNAFMEFIDILADLQKLSARIANNSKHSSSIYWTNYQRSLMDKLEEFSRRLQKTGEFDIEKGL